MNWLRISRFILSLGARMFKLVLAVIALLISGCTPAKSFVKRMTTDVDTDPKVSSQYQEEARKRVVYTPLISGKPSTDAQTVEILLRPPTKSYREIGFISMYRKYGHETAADLLPFVRERAAKEGASAVLLTEAEDKQIGTYTQGGAGVWGGAAFASSSSVAIREGTIRGLAIVYEE